jgi:hypothetical protein
MKIKRIVDDEVYTTKRGFRKWTSVLGSMTGMGGDLFVVDEPLRLKNRACCRVRAPAAVAA